MRQEKIDLISAIVHSDAFIVCTQIIVITVLIKIANFIIGRFADKIKNFSKDTEFTKQIDTTKHIIESAVDTVIATLGIMYVLNKLGIDIRPILTAAGILGVAVGFGAKRFVEDVISGLILILEGQIRVGDVVDIAGKIGTVEKVDIKLVQLRDMSGNVHYIRNGMIDIVTNMTRDYSYYMFDIGVAYKENLTRVFEVFKELVEDFRANFEHRDYILAPLELLGVDSLEDSAVMIKARYRTRPRMQWQVGRAFYKAIKDRFDEKGIELPFPQRTLHIEHEEKERINE